jgi:Uma2 family endonuclease
MAGNCPSTICLPDGEELCMTTAAPANATLDDLYGVEGKAELIGGRIVRYMASGVAPARLAFRIARSLEEHSERSGRGLAFPDGIGFALSAPLPSGRQSFSPDASYYDGPLPQNLMRFIDGAPTFAVEVRSENSYGQVAEDQMADKRADYFLAGTKVLWDVDPLAETIAVYHSDGPEQPKLYRGGEIAEAEPAVPGWQLPVDALFRATP